MRGEENGNIIEDLQASADVLPVMRLKEYVFALESLLEGEIAKRIKSRLSKSVWVSYGIGDASGNVYGAAVYLKIMLSYRYGQWFSEISEQFSNYRELGNSVDTIEKLYHEDHLKNYELVLFTDNLVADYDKDKSSSNFFLEIVLRLRKIQIQSNCILHLFHIVGERMKECGINAL